MTVYIYALRCPIENTVRYIGKSENPQLRLATHISRARCGATKHRTAHWIRKLLAQGLAPELQVLAQVPDGIRWQDVERGYIANAEAAGWRLTNSTEGGDGVPLTDDEARAKWIAAQKATRSTAEFKAKQSLASKKVSDLPGMREFRAAKANEAWADPARRSKFMEGMARPDAKERRSFASKARFDLPGYRDKVAARISAGHSTPEARIAQSRRAKAMHADPEFAARRAASLKATYARPEVKARQAAISAEVGARPEVKALRAKAIAESWKRPESRAARLKGIKAASAKIAESVSKAWTDPAHRERMSKALKAGHATPEAKARLKASRAAMWSDPERRAALIAKQKEVWQRRKEQSMAAVKPMSTEEDKALVPAKPKPKKQKKTYRRRDMRAE